MKHFDNIGWIDVGGKQIRKGKNSNDEAEWFVPIISWDIGYDPLSGSFLMTPGTPLRTTNLPKMFLYRSTLYPPPDRQNGGL